MLRAMLSRMATKPPVVMPLEKTVRTLSGICRSTSGISSTPMPKARLDARMSTDLRPSYCEATMRTPAAATVPNMSSVAPPSTGYGISEKAMPTTGNRPSRMSITAMK